MFRGHGLAFLIGASVLLGRPELASAADKSGKLQVGEETVVRHLTGKSFHPDAPASGAQGKQKQQRVALALALNNCLLSGSALGGLDAGDSVLTLPTPSTTSPSDAYKCVQRVGTAAVVSYRAIAGDREAAANLDAVVTTLGFGGAVLGQSHWSKADTLDWWIGAGTVGLVYDELSGTKSRALIYASGAQAARTVLFRSLELDKSVSGLDELEAPYEWTVPIKRPNGELEPGRLKAKFEDRYAVVCGLPTIPDEFESSPGRVAAEVFQRDASARCAELTKTYAKLRSVRRKLCPPARYSCANQSAVWLANDLNQVDELVSNGDRAVRARATDVAGVVVRSAANVLSNLAVKLNASDAAPVSYVPRSLAGAGDPLELSGFQTLAVPAAIGGDLLGPPELSRFGSDDETEANYLEALKTHLAALNELTAWLDDRVTDAELIQAISRRNKLKFDLTNSIRPVYLMAVN